MSYRSVSRVGWVIVLVALTVVNRNAFADTITAPLNGLSVHVNAAEGSYVLSSTDPDWNFGGSLKLPLKDLATASGHDTLGEFQQVSFAWRADGTPMSGQIRIYQTKPLVFFSQTCGAARLMPPTAFPSFTKLPSTLHVFSYGQSNFAPPAFTANDISTPWLLFDDQANALVISPASHFMVASMSGDGHTNMSSAFNPKLRNVPAGFTQQTLVALGTGINRTWDLWGQAMLDLQHTKRRAIDSDAISKYLGYWTDNGAVYYYNYDLEKGYAGTMEALVNHYRQEQIPIRYLQLDSWWYYKTTMDADGKQGKEKKVARLPAGEWNRYGGLLEYRAHKDLFPDGLGAFQKSINLPLVTHSRWVDPASPYHDQYKISGIAAVDPKWWDNIAGYLKTSGIVTYEQDWLDHIYDYSPFASDVETGDAFLDNMSRACREQGVTLQYCMAYPCHFLQGSRYENLTTIRTSGDRFNTNKWNNFLYTSRLASSLGILPWADVYLSTEANNVLLSTLSAGPVGVGDAIGAENKPNLLRAVRSDGVIVKPDASIVPMDGSYIADAKKLHSPLVASTYTDHDGIKTEYVFAFNRNKTAAGQTSFTPGEIGVSRESYVYDYFTGAGKALKADGAFSAPLASNAAAFYVVAPVGQSGIAFLGDKDKFVGTGKQRIDSLHDEAGKLTVGIVLAENEKSVTLHGYSAVEPKATVISGLDDAVQYNPATHYFTVVAKTEADTPMDKSSADPTRRITLVLETRTK